MGDLFSQFYAQLFSSSQPHRLEECIQDVPRRISAEMHISMGEPFTEQEVTIAFFQMNSYGAPSPFGFPAHFYYIFWLNVKNDVCQFALKILNNNSSLEEINTTFVVLIPKLKEARRVGDFRPIILCNVLYKIVAKTIANRIKQFLPLIIFPN